MSDRKSKIEEGEEICPTCNGKGRFKLYSCQGGYCYKLCPKCKGEGKLDWVEKITGKR